MKHIKNSVNIILFCLFCSLTALQAQDNIIDGIVAVVGGDAVYKSDIEAQYMRMKAEGVDVQGDLKCRLLEDMMIQKLLLNQSRLDSIEVSESEVLNAVDQRMQYFISQIGSKEKVEEYFKKNSVALKEELKDVIREQNLTEQMRNKITKDIKTTPSEVRVFFKDFNKDSLPLIPEQYEILQIMAKPKVDQAEIDRIKNRLREFQDRIKAGEDFNMLAILYSEDLGSARRGGELGMKGKGEFVPEFADVAFSLRDPKHVSRIVESEYGYHIIQLISREGSKINCRHILLKPRISDNASKAALARLDSISEGIKTNKIPFEQAALLYSEDKDSRSNGGLIANPNTGASRFRLTELPGELSAQVEKLKVGDISKPFKMVDAKGQEVYVMIKIKNKLPAHKANVTDDYQILKDVVLNKKKETKLNEWIKEKQGDTYISIDPKWINCDFRYSGWIKK